MPVRRIFVILAIIAALPVGAVVLVRAAGAWSLNLANASIARAGSLPVDAPARSAELARAQTDLAQAHRFADLDRLALAQLRSLMLSGDTTDAARALADSNAVSEDALTEFTRGNAAWRSGQPSRAFEHWRAAGAFTYFMQQAHRAADAHDWQTAAESASIAVGIAPASADARYVLADATSRLAPVTPAVFADLDAALSLTQDNEFRSTILSRKGELYASQGNLEQALASFEQARSVAPIDARPRTGYALVLLQLQPGSRDTAVTLLRQVVDDSPRYTAAYIALAGLAQSGGDEAGAQAWLQKGLQRNPNDARLLLPLGELYARQHRMEEARATLVEALKYETHADALIEIAERLAEMDRAGAVR